MATRLFCIYLIIFVCLSSIVNAEPAEYESGELIVRFAPKPDGKQLSVIERTNISAAIAGATVDRSSKLVPGLSLVKLPANLSVKNAQAAFSQNKDILYAHPNYIVHARSYFPNDPDFINNSLWGLHQSEQNGTKPDADIDAPEAWDVNTICTSKIIVAVIDSGVDYTHPDLAANMWNGNAYHGYDFCTRDDEQTDPDPMDDRGHGTHVAGIIGAVGNNGIGITGVCWNVKIMALKFLDSTGAGRIYDAIECIEYAVENGAKVLNNSWGAYLDESDPEELTLILALEDIVEAANDNGVLFIAATGNNGFDSDFYHSYPDGLECANVISVMATNWSDQIANWQGGSSNYGETSVDLGAPGQEILGYWLDNGYRTASGTSGAAPYVAGACALLWSNEPDLTHLEVKARILNGADKLDALKGKCVTEGRLNVDNALRNQQGQWKIHNYDLSKAYSTITQAALEADNDDEIIVDPGLYYEQAVIGSKELTIKSTNPNDPAVVANTIIDCYGGNAITLTDNGDSTIEGLTISDCKGGGTGVVLQRSTVSSDVTVSKCRISCGGNGISNTDSTVDVIDCLISDSEYAVHSSGGYGTRGTTVYNCQIENCAYGIFAASQHSFTVNNSIISGKTGSYGIYLQTQASSSPKIYDNLICRHSTGIAISNNANVPVAIRNNTIFGNSYRGINFMNGNDSSPVSNCIIWGNGTEINPSDKTNVSYSCVEVPGPNSFPGTDNIKDNPNFVDSDVNNFHLRFDSPCIDTGDPEVVSEQDETDIDGQDRVIDGDHSGDPYVDMGADEYWVGDFNHDGIVNFKDFANLAKFWMLSSQLYDLDGNSTINHYDFDIFTTFWLSTNSTYVPDGGGDQMQDGGLGDDLESESLLDEDGQATISLVCDVNDPNEGDEVTVYVHTDMPLYALWYMDITITGDADIIDAMNYYTIDCNAYGWSEGFALDSFIDDANGVVEIGGIAWPEEANDIVGYFTFQYHSGQVGVSITDGWADDTIGLAQFSQEALLFGRDPNEP